MGRVSRQCQALLGTATWPVCQGLTAAGGFRGSRVKWVTVGRGDSSGGDLAGGVPSLPWPGSHANAA